MPELTSPLDFALAYAARGWPVFPLHTPRGGGCSCGRDCGSVGKHPRTPHGLKDATCDPDVIRSWWTTWPDANVAILTGAASGIIVLDIDPRNGGDETLDVLEHEHGPLPSTPLSLTGGGGQHYIFSHPGGHVANRTGLFVGIDLKADGGYIVCPPSRHASGGVYCWHRSPNELQTAPEPEWIADARPAAQPREAPAADAPRHEGNGHDASESLLKRGRAYVAAAAGVKEGGRNKTAFLLAGHLASLRGERGERLGETETLELCRSWNVWNKPPLGDTELRETVASALANGTPRPEKPDRPRPATAADGGDQPPPEPPQFQPIAASDLVREHPELHAVVIDGLLRAGETMNVISHPKVGKSWLIHSLAVATAAGLPWLGKSTARGRVLLVDAELHKATLARRLHRTQAMLGVSDADFGDLHVWAIRGERLTIDDIARALHDTPAGTYRLILVDALYRVLPLDGEENANETMTRVYNVLDAIASRSGAAVAVVHHSTKGSQADKLITDVGSGGGAQSRAADCHLILRPHETEGGVAVDAAVRSFPPPTPFAIRWTNPGWELAPDLDPTQLKRPTRGGRNAAPKSDAPSLKLVRQWTPEEFASEVVGDKPSIRPDIIARAVEAGMSKAAAGELLKRAVEAGQVARGQDAPASPVRFRLRVVSPELWGGDGSACPPPPGLHARGGVGGDACIPPPSPPDGGKKRKRKGKTRAKRRKAAAEAEQIE